MKRVSKLGFSYLASLLVMVLSGLFYNADGLERIIVQMLTFLVARALYEEVYEK